MKKTKLSEAERQEKILELKRRKLEALQAQLKFQEDNILEYFNSSYPLVDGTYMRPNPPQQQLLDAWPNRNYKVFTFSGANRIGKTFIATIIAISTMIGKWPWNDEKLYFNHRKARRVRYIGQGWESHIKSVVIPELERLWPKARPVEIKKNSQGYDAFWKDIKTGSTMQIMSNKQDSKMHEGWYGDLIIYDEPPTRDIRVANARGLVDRAGRELFCCTLLSEAWIDREVIRAIGEDGRPDKSVYTISAEINDNIGYGITKEGVEQFKKTLTKEEFDARILGIPAYMSGLVYPMYNRDTHLKPRFKVPLDWPVDIAIDTHPRKPHSVLFLATNQYGLKYIIHELRMNGNGQQLADEIVRIVTWGNYRINRVICDPLAKGDGNMPVTTFDNIANVLARYDILLETASKAKDTGILEVKTHLMGPNNEPSLFIFDDLIYTIQEIEGYMWEKADVGEKEKASKKSDDMMENLYRLILLNTEYEDYDKCDINDYDDYGTTINKTTGY